MHRKRAVSNALNFAFETASFASRGCEGFEAQGLNFGCEKDERITVECFLLRLKAFFIIFG